MSGSKYPPEGWVFAVRLRFSTTVEKRNRGDLGPARRLRWNCCTLRFRKLRLNSNRSCIGQRDDQNRESPSDYLTFHRFTPLFVDKQRGLKPYGIRNSDILHCCDTATMLNCSAISDLCFNSPVVRMNSLGVIGGQFVNSPNFPLFKLGCHTLPTEWLWSWTYVSILHMSRPPMVV